MNTNQLYTEAKETAFGWKWIIYHYDDAGNREIIKFTSDDVYETKESALDAAGEFEDDHNINSETIF